MSILTPSIITHLTTLYSQPTRHYHNLSHITALLDLLEEYKSHFNDPEAVEAAIWFHDAVYDPRAKGDKNELDSAELAVQMLTQESGSAESNTVGRIKTMIEATATHKIPFNLTKLDIIGRGTPRDLALFLDMDLAILGAEEGEFDEYEGNVRREYEWVDDEGWRTGRAGALRGLLGASSVLPVPADNDDDSTEKPEEKGEGEGQSEGGDSEKEKEKERGYIFHTDLFRGLFEEQARRNIARSLRKLEGTS